MITAIGLRIQNYRQCAKIDSFIRKSTLEKQNVILKWVIDDLMILPDVLNETKKITIKDIRKVLPDSLMDNDVDVTLIQEYFERSAFQKLNNLIKEMKTKDNFTCYVCKKKVILKCIRCDSRFLWFDYKCESIKKSVADKMSKKK